MKVLFLILILASNNAAFAAAAEAPSFRYSDLETLAKKAIDYEVNHVNEHLARRDMNIPGYSSRQLKFLQTIGKTDIEPSYLYNKCIMTEQAIDAGASKTLSGQNDCVAPLIGALANVKTIYNQKMWKLTARLCEKSMARFATRMRHATVEGQPLNLSEETISRLSKLVFFPVEYGRPSFFKVLHQNAILVLYGGLFTGAVLYLSGLSHASVVVSLFSAGMSALSFRDNLPRAQNDLRDLNFSLISNSGYQKLDLTVPPHN